MVPRTRLAKIPGAATLQRFGEATFEKLRFGRRRIRVGADETRRSLR